MTQSIVIKKIKPVGFKNINFKNIENRCAEAVKINKHGCKIKYPLPPAPSFGLQPNYYRYLQGI